MPFRGVCYRFHRFIAGYSCELGERGDSEAAGIESREDCCRRCCDGARMQTSTLCGPADGFVWVCAAPSGRQGPRSGGRHQSVSSGPLPILCTSYCTFILYTSPRSVDFCTVSVRCMLPLHIYAPLSSCPSLILYIVPSIQRLVYSNYHRHVIRARQIPLVRQP